MINEHRCLYWTCRNDAMACDEYCAEHRAQYGLYRPQTYVQAYAKAKARFEATGERHFVYRHRHEGDSHKGYGTARITVHNWVDAIFSEIVFPNEGLVSTNTAQETMYAILHESSVITLAVAGIVWAVVR